MNEPFVFYEESAAWVRARMPFAPQIAVIPGLPSRSTITTFPISRYPPRRAMPES